MDCKQHKQIDDCTQGCREREKLKEGDNQLRINAIDDEHDFLALTKPSVRIKIKVHPPFGLVF